MSLKFALYLLPLPILLAIGCGGTDIAQPTSPVPEPLLLITSPEYNYNSTIVYRPVVRFRWENIGEREVDATRYLITECVDSTGTYDPSFDLLADLGANPSRYDTLWSKWTAYDAPDDSGVMTIIGDDEAMTLGRKHIFAVQAKDRIGNVTEEFDPTVNAREFTVYQQNGPVLMLYEPLLAGYRFLGSWCSPKTLKIPPGLPLRFIWAGLTTYDTEITGYRYGWDIPDLEEWDERIAAEITSADEVTFYSGNHTLYVEVYDLAGALTRGCLRIEVAPWPMDRELLWVDDYYAPWFPAPNLTFPSEDEHDEFWLGICSKAPGFDPVRDEYDCTRNIRHPRIEDVGRYRNMIWTYSPGEDNSWGSVVRYTSEGALLDQIPDGTPNVISIFLRKGGHVWTLGRSDRNGGLAEVLEPTARTFPLDLECEINGPTLGCGDRSGIRSMPYEDYCVTAIDKVVGVFRQDPRMPFRYLDKCDVLLQAYRDSTDPVTAAHPGLPERLELRDEVKGPTSYFCTAPDCNPGGFTYVEVYDPEYWLSAAGAFSRSCFHPVYRMRSANEISALDQTTIAIWITRYEDIVPDAPGGTAAPSIHFGVPLWYFRHESVDSIADVIFTGWGIGGGG
jgi:hypothetical protein